MVYIAVSSKGLCIEHRSKLSRAHTTARGCRTSQGSLWLVNSLKYAVPSSMRRKKYTFFLLKLCKHIRPNNADQLYIKKSDILGARGTWRESSTVYLFSDYFCLETPYIRKEQPLKGICRLCKQKTGFFFNILRTGRCSVEKQTFFQEHTHTHTSSFFGIRGRNTLFKLEMLVMLVAEQGIHFLMLPEACDVCPKRGWNSRCQWKFSAVMAVRRNIILLPAYSSPNRLSLHKDGTKVAFSTVEMKSCLLHLSVNTKMIPSAVLCVWSLIC